MEGRARAWGRRIELSLRCARLRKWAPLVAAAAALGPPPLPEPTRDTVNPPCLCTWLHPWARACTEPEGGSDLGDGLHGGGRVLRPCGGHAAAPLRPSDGWSLRCKRSSGASAAPVQALAVLTPAHCEHPAVAAVAAEVFGHAAARVVPASVVVGGTVLLRAWNGRLPREGGGSSPRRFGTRRLGVQHPEMRPTHRLTHRSTCSHTGQHGTRRAAWEMHGRFKGDVTSP